MYSIVIDEAHRLLRLKFWGFMTLEDVANYERDRTAAAMRFGGPSASYAILADLTDYIPQSADVANAFKTMMAAVRGKRKIAIVTGSLLSKMQVKRTLDGENAGIFDRIAEAEAWLLTSQKDQAAA